MKAMVEVVAANLGVQVEYKSKHQTEQRADQNHYGDDLFRVLRIFKRIHDLSKPVNGDYQNQNVTHQTNEEYGIAYEVASRCHRKFCRLAILSRRQYFLRKLCRFN